MKISHTDPSRYKIRVLGRHKKSCFAVNSQAQRHRDNPLWIPDRKAVWLDALGRHNRGCSFRWHLLECSSTDCGARVLVREDFITMTVHQIMEAKP